MIAGSFQLWIWLFAAGVAARPSVELERVTVMGSMSREMVRKVADRHADGLLTCYADAQKRHSELSGTVIVRYVVSSIGQVSGATIKESTLDDAPMHACLIRELERWQFPSAKCGGINIVECTWRFD